MPSRAIAHVELVAMDEPRVQGDMTVVIDGGRIADVGPAGSIDTSAMHTTDGRGMFLMPGLADMHAHYQDHALAGAFIANGITQVRNMWGTPYHLALRAKIENGELAGPHLATTSPIVDGLGTTGQIVWPNSVALTDPEHASSYVDRFAERGYQQLKAYQWLDLAALRALGQGCARTDLRMVGHCPDGVTFEQAIDAGMSCFEHLTGIAFGHLADGLTYPSLRDPIGRRGTPESLRLMADHLDFDSIRRLAGLMAERQAWACPTLVVWQKQNQDPEVALMDEALAYEMPGMVRGWEAGLRGRLASVGILPDEWLSLARGRDAALSRVVGILRDEGAPLLLGTDTPNPFVTFGFSIHQELANLVEAGLSPWEALRCGTTEAARFLGESDEWGTVARGKRADVLLLRANPLQDVAAVRQVESVFLNGVHYTRADLDAMLQERVGRARAVPSAPEAPPLPAASEGVVARQGVFLERAANVSLGCCSFEHRRLPDGNWFAAEEYVATNDRRRSTRLWLTSDWTIERAETSLTSPVGADRTSVRRTQDGYTIESVGPDGFSASASLASGPLAPADFFSPTLLAQAVATGAGGTLETLSVDHGEPTIVPVVASIATDGTRTIEVQRRGDPSRLVASLSPTGDVDRVESTVMGLPRELVRQPT